MLFTTTVSESPATRRAGEPLQPATAQSTTTQARERMSRYTIISLKKTASHGGRLIQMPLLSASFPVFTRLLLAPLLLLTVLVRLSLLPLFVGLYLRYPGFLGTHRCSPVLSFDPTLSQPTPSFSRRPHTGISSAEGS